GALRVHGDGSPADRGERLPLRVRLAIDPTARAHTARCMLRSGVEHDVQVSRLDPQVFRLCRDDRRHGAPLVPGKIVDTGKVFRAAVSRGDAAEVQAWLEKVGHYHLRFLSSTARQSSAPLWRGP